MRGRIIRIMIIFVTLMGLFYWISPRWISKALMYQKVGIEDYNLFENREIPAVAGQPWEFADDFNSKTLTEKGRQRLEDEESIAFLVIQNKQIKYEEYWDGFSEFSLTNSFSAAKSVVGLLVGCALQDGYLESLDQKVSTLLTEFKEKGRENLRIRDLITMSSGLNWDESYGSLFSTTTQAYYGDDLNSLVIDLEQETTPGTEFKYLSGNSQLLAMVVEKATKMRISEYASLRLWNPMHAERTALWCLDDENGMEKAYCCFNSNARDFARFGQLVLNKGKWDDRQLISKKYIEELTSPADYLKDEEGKSVDYYGYHWWILNYKGMRIPYARGILGQYIFVVPDLDAVVVRLGHHRSKVYEGAHPDDIFDYVDEAIEILK